MKQMQDVLINFTVALPLSLSHFPHPSLTQSFSVHPSVAQSSPLSVHEPCKFITTPPMYKGKKGQEKKSCKPVIWRCNWCRRAIKRGEKTRRSPRGRGGGVEGWAGREHQKDEERSPEVLLLPRLARREKRTYPALSSLHHLTVHSGKIQTNSSSIL